MNRETAATLLSSSRYLERLLAARFFVSSGDLSDREIVNTALLREENSFVRSTLKAALERIDEQAKATESSQDFVVAEAEDETLAALRNEIYGQVASAFKHELSPILGILEAAGPREINHFDTSETRKALIRFRSLINALKKLSKATEPPTTTEFELSEMMGRFATDPQFQTVSIDLAGRRPFIIRTDESLLDLAVFNCVRNAVEASTILTAGKKPKVVITWEENESSVWISILDEGVGIPPKSWGLFQMGTTNKDKGLHTGMGLFLAKTALNQIDGTIELSPRDGGGTSCRISIKKTK